MNGEGRRGLNECGEDSRGLAFVVRVLALPQGNEALFARRGRLRELCLHRVEGCVDGLNQTRSDLKTTFKQPGRGTVGKLPPSLL